MTEIRSLNDTTASHGWQAQRFYEFCKRAFDDMEVRRFTSKGEIYSECVRRWEDKFRGMNCVRTISPIMGMATETLYVKIQDKDRHFTAEEQDRFFRATMCPEAFLWLQRLIFYDFLETDDEGK